LAGGEPAGDLLPGVALVAGIRDGVVSTVSSHPLDETGCPKSPQPCHAELGPVARGYLPAAGQQFPDLLAGALRFQLDGCVGADLDKFAGDLRATHPHFVYTPHGEPQALHNAGRLAWGSGPSGEAPDYTGMDLIIVRDGKIAALYVFLDSTPS